MSEKTLTGAEVTRPPRVGRLVTLADIRKEMVKVYRAVRRGDLESQEGTRLTYMLISIAKAIEGGDLEKRLEALEASLEGRPPMEKPQC